MPMQELVGDAAQLTDASPVASAATRAAANPSLPYNYGGATKGNTFGNIAAQMAGSTPEAALFKAFRAKKGSQAAKIYPASRRNAVARLLGGSGVRAPRAARR
jgi:hypothetical protein